MQYSNPLWLITHNHPQLVNTNVQTFTNQTRLCYGNSFVMCYLLLLKYIKEMGYLTIGNE